MAPNKNLKMWVDLQCSTMLGSVTKVKKMGDSATATCSLNAKTDFNIKM